LRLRDKKRKEATLYGFKNGQDGGDPVSGVAIDAAGILYGVASPDGGEFGDVYQLKPSNFSGFCRQ